MVGQTLGWGFTCAMRKTRKVVGKGPPTFFFLLTLELHTYILSIEINFQGSEIRQQILQLKWAVGEGHRQQIAPTIELSFGQVGQPRLIMY